MWPWHYLGRGGEHPATGAAVRSWTGHRLGAWLHGVGDVVSAVAAAGLRLEFLHEHDHGHFRLPAGLGVPLVYSLRAAKVG